MNRRGFLQAIIASGVAPYVCTAAGVLMPVKKLAAPAYLTDPDAWFVVDGELVLYGDDFNADLRRANAKKLAQAMRETLAIHERYVMNMLAA